MYVEKAMHSQSLKYGEPLAITEKDCGQSLPQGGCPQPIKKIATQEPAIN